MRWLALERSEPEIEHGDRAEPYSERKDSVTDTETLDNISDTSRGKHLEYVGERPEDGPVCTTVDEQKALVAEPSRIADAGGQTRSWSSNPATLVRTAAMRSRLRGGRRTFSRGTWSAMWKRSCRWLASGEIV